MEKTIERPEKESKAEDLQLLFKKHKKLMQEYYHFVPFKEPVLFLARRTGKVEFKENVTTGRYDFKHSDGNERWIVIQGNQLNFQVGDKTFKGYFCHEDYPFPLPQEPLLLTEQFNMVIDKTIHDNKEWDTKALKEKGKMWLRIAGGICAIIGMIILYKILVPTAPAPALDSQIAQIIESNATMLINQSTITVI